MSESDSGTVQRADPIDVRVAAVWPAVDRLHRAAGRAEGKDGVIADFANATAEAVAEIAHLAHDAGRTAQAGAARCANCPASDRERTRRQQKIRDAAGWAGVGVALAIGIAGLLARFFGW